jgi:hypothetical protein
MSMQAMPGDYSRERDARRAQKNIAERTGSFDVVPAGDPVEIKGDPEWSNQTKELWMIATQSEVAQHRWSATDFVMLRDVLSWWEEVPPHKRGAHAYACRAGGRGRAAHACGRARGLCPAELGPPRARRSR